MPSDFATSSTCARSAAVSGMPFFSRSSRRATRPWPGTRISSTPGSRLRRGEVADVAIDLGLEQVGRDEARDVERDDELPDIEITAHRRREIADVAAERGAVERARQQADDDRQPGAFVVAHRQIGAVVDSLGIGDRRAVLAVLHPAFRQRPALERVGAYGAVRCQGRGDVEHDRRFRAGRDRDRDRVGSEQRLRCRPTAPCD